MRFVRFVRLVHFVWFVRFVRFARFGRLVGCVRAGRVLVTLGLLVGAVLPAGAQSTGLQPFALTGDTPAPPWRVVGLPGQTKPFTRFAVAQVDGRRALRIEADRSYGNLVHPLRYTAATAQLAWHWRIDQPIDAADLRTREGDDTAVKVCVFFDLPIDKVPFAERQTLRLARWKTGEPLPAATVCYVWDAQLPAGTVIGNAFTRRMRYIVLRTGTQRLGTWIGERRDVAADFLQAFGDEADALPPIIGVAVGADADNTASRSLAHVANVELRP